MQGVVVVSSGGVARNRVAREVGGRSVFANACFMPPVKWEDASAKNADETMDASSCCMAGSGGKIQPDLVHA